MAPCKSGLLPEGLPCINNNIEIEIENRNSFEDENAYVSRPLPPPCFQRPCESSMNPTEMPSNSENHKNIDGGEEGELNSDS